MLNTNDMSGKIARHLQQQSDFSETQICIFYSDEGYDRLRTYCKGNFTDRQPLHGTAPSLPDRESGTDERISFAIERRWNMYIPRSFKIEDWPEIRRFIAANTLATLVSSDREYPVATHIPLELEDNSSGKMVLSGHVAKANPHWTLFESQPNVLAIFLSPIQHYISSSWYSQPNVPTWNYMSVHVYGKLKIVESDRLRESLKKMTNYHEQISPYPLEANVLQSEINKQIDGIVGFEIAIERVEAAYKMSQNRNDEDYKNIIMELENLDDYNAMMVAKKMAKIRKLD